MNKKTLINILKYIFFTIFKKKKKACYIKSIYDLFII